MFTNSTSVIQFNDFWYSWLMSSKYWYWRNHHYLYLKSWIFYLFCWVCQIACHECHLFQCVLLANVPKACQPLIFTCQSAKWRANFSTLPTKRPINFSAIFQNNFQFLNFLIMLTIWKFQEYLGNTRKFISKNKKFEFWL